VRGGFSYAAALKCNIPAEQTRDVSPPTSDQCTGEETSEPEEHSEAKELFKDVFKENAPPSDAKELDDEIPETIKPSKPPVTKSLIDPAVSWADKLMGRTTPPPSADADQTSTDSPVLPPPAEEHTPPVESQNTVEVAAAKQTEPSNPPEQQTNTQPLPSLDPNWSWAEKVRGRQQEASLEEPPSSATVPEAEAQAEANAEAKAEANAGAEVEGTAEVAATVETPEVAQNPAPQAQAPAAEGWTSVQKPPPKAKRPRISKNWAKRQSQKCDPQSSKPGPKAKTKTWMKAAPSENLVVTQGKSVACPQARVSADGGSWADRVKGQEAEPAAEPVAESAIEPVTKARTPTKPVKRRVQLKQPQEQAADTPAEAPRAPEVRQTSWADRVRGAQCAVPAGKTLADRARESGAGPDGGEWPAEREERSKMCEASPTQLQFAEGDGDDEVPLLDCNHGAVWVGSLKIRFNNKKWITEQFGPHCLTRILEHGEGFAILEFPKIQVPTIVETFNGLRVDNRRLVLKASNKFLSAEAA
jgi:hypothetical protein